MNDIGERIIIEMKDRGADLVAFADLSGVDGVYYPRGISIAVSVSRQIVESMKTGPTKEYYDEYITLNEKLDTLAKNCANILTEHGFRAFAQTTTEVPKIDDFRTVLPHKTVATRSGLGFVGKCALVVTERFGSAIRLTSVLTDAPLECAVPITEPLCKECRNCQKACPANAIHGTLWSPKTDRDLLVDINLCKNVARASAKNVLGFEVTLCGRCIAVCPFTNKYLKSKDM